LRCYLKHSNAADKISSDIFKNVLTQVTFEAISGDPKRF